MTQTDFSPQVARPQAGVYTLAHFGPKVLAAFSGRLFTKSRQREFLDAIQIDPSDFYRVTQVHGKEIVIVDPEAKGTRIDQADGLVSSRPGIALGILTADCIPAFFWDPEKEVIAMVHAGWKGLHQGILEAMLQKLRDSFGSVPLSLRIILGPAIRQCCYEVGPEFKHYFPETCQEERMTHGREEMPRLYMDLIQEAKNRLFRQGILPGHLFDTSICTACQNEHFFSARREQTQERILSVIQIRP